MKYKFITFDDKPSIIQRTDDDGTTWFIPLDPANSDYQQYLKETADGNN